MPGMFTPGRYKQIDLRLLHFSSNPLTFHVVYPLSFMKAAVVLKREKSLIYKSPRILSGEGKKMDMNVFEPPPPIQPKPSGSVEKAVTNGQGQDWPGQRGVTVHPLACYLTDGFYPH